MKTKNLFRAASAALFVVLAGAALASWPAFYTSVDNSAEGSVVKTDFSGNVYMAGNSSTSATGSDFLLIKYDHLGNQQWVRTYNGPANGQDYINSMAIDEGGQIYITGTVDTVSTQPDIATVCYNSNGTLQWAKQYDGSGYPDYAMGIAADPSGGCVVVGTASLNFGSRFVTIRYGFNGDKLWARQHGTSGSATPNAVITNNSGEVFVTGQSEGPSGSNDMTTIKYSYNGTREWIKYYDGPAGADEVGMRISQDQSGNIYAGGFSWSGSRYDYIVLKYDQFGNKVWLNRRHAADTDNYLYGLEVTTDGSVFVSGNSVNPVLNFTDILTLKIDASTGNTVWAKRIHSLDPATPVMNVASLHYDNDTLYVTGTHIGDFSTIKNKYVVAKYKTSTGTRSWLKTYENPTMSCSGTSSAYDSIDHKVYVTGYGYDSATSALSVVTTKF